MSVRALLGHRSYVALLTGRTVSLSGNAMASIALAFAVLDLTGSATDLGLVLAARSLPQVVFLLLGGVIADRLPRHLVLVVTNVLSGLTQATTAGLVLSGHASVGSLAALGALNGASAAFIFPATAGLLPQTVPLDQLQTANVVLRMASTTAQIAGVALGGAVVAGFGSGWGLAWDAASFLVAAACFALVRIDPHQRISAGNMLVELREGWSAFRSRTWLWVVVLAFGVINAMQAAGFNTLGPKIADESFGRQGWGFVLAADTAGAFLSGLVLLRVRFRRPLYVGMLGVLVWSPLMLVLAAEPAVILLVAAAFVAGAAMELFGVGWDLSMQQHVPPELLSRVYAYDGLGSIVAIPLGQALAGPAAAWLGVQEAVVLCAVVLMVAGAGAILVPAVRRLERVDPRPAETEQLRA